MDVLFILIIFLISAVLFAIEVFLTPGLGLAGLGAACGVIIGDWMVFDTYGVAVGLWVLAASIVVSLLLTFGLMRSRTLERLSLKQRVESTAATPEQLSVKMGDTGVALTRLALIGNALIDGKQVEVKSVDGFLEEGTSVVVTGVSQALILVKRIS